MHESGLTVTCLPVMVNYSNVLTSQFLLVKTPSHLTEGNKYLVSILPQGISSYNHKIFDLLIRVHGDDPLLFFVSFYVLFFPFFLFLNHCRLGLGLDLGFGCNFILCFSSNFLLFSLRVRVGVWMSKM